MKLHFFLILIVTTLGTISVFAQKMSNHQTVILNCKQLNLNKVNTYKDGKVSVELYHKHGEPLNANRLQIKAGDFAVELLPSKGLSLGQVLHKKQKLFWEAPYSLPDPDALDLWSDDVLIDGKEVEGFMFLKTFIGGIELYGFKNWGMPFKEEKSGQLFPVHGEASNIPIDNVVLKIYKDSVVVTSEFIYRDTKEALPQPWYENGEPIFKITKNYVFRYSKKPEILIKDIIENISDIDQKPDWGYHITFFPQDGSKLMVPSRLVELRGDGVLPKDIETWQSPKESSRREETGILHKNLRTLNSANVEYCNILVQHPNGHGLTFRFPSSPYFQTWFCRGGAGTDEFKLKNGESLNKRNWDGLGIEIGASALDHDGNIDPNVKYFSILSPGDKKIIEMELKITNKTASKKMAYSINEFNKKRKYHDK